MMISAVISLLRQMAQQSKSLNNSRAMINMLTDDIKKGFETKDRDNTVPRLDLIRRHAEDIEENLTRMKLITEAMELLYELTTNTERNRPDDILFKLVHFEGKRFLLSVSLKECIWADISDTVTFNIVEEYMLGNRYETSDFLTNCRQHRVTYGFLWSSDGSTCQN